MARINLTTGNIDTQGIVLFDAYAAGGKLDKVKELAAIIMKHAKSPDVKQHVRRRIIEILAQQYDAILGYSADDFESARAGFVTLYTGATAHKKLDISREIAGFSELATRYVGSERTSLQFDRLYTLFQSVKNTADVPGVIVELGVYRGGSLKFLGELSAKKLYGFDTFLGHPRVSKEDGFAHGTGDFKGDGLEAVRAYLGDRATLVPGDVTESFQLFSETIALAHLDLDLYEPTAVALPLVWKLLSPRGVIVLDDYGFTSCPGAKKAADEFLTTVQSTSYHLMTGQMVIVK